MKTRQKQRPMLYRVTLWRGLSKAANRLGCSVSHLSEIIHGRRAASDAIARFLKTQGIAVGQDGFVREGR